ncbi:MAG: hypothetical protein MJA83_14175, partial [Gammaproteobacteria bacterium]|nr:hypothetical protein [Gammaproteobacteria bacterium]
MNRQFLFSKSMTVISFTALYILFNQAHAGEVTLPHTFQADTKAVAAEVNENFTAAITGINDNNTKLGELETQVQALQEALASLKTENE